MATLDLIVAVLVRVVLIEALVFAAGFVAVSPIILYVVARRKLNYAQPPF